MKISKRSNLDINLGTPGWQGSAFQLNRNVSAPVHPPTNCIKARHMFEYCPATLSNPDWANIIKRDILNRYTSC